jgi:PcfJ-like protein
LASSPDRNLFNRAARHFGYEHPQGALILRPDRFVDTEPRNAVLQRITGGFRRSIFRHSIEEELRRFIHHEALRRAGLPWPPQPQPDDPPWWSKDERQQARNRGIYHGLRVSSLKTINHLIGHALEEAADADAIKAARRFAFRHRENIYRASARSRRALQLTSTFPVLALMIYSDSCPEHQSELNNFAARKKAAADLVERGARLRDVAAAMGIPMAMRCIKPGAVHLTPYVFREHSELLRLMPEALPRSRICLRVVGWAHHKAGADFARWAARTVPHIPGGLEQIGSFLSDISDWVRAGTGSGETGEEITGRQFVMRPFTPSMSLKTVTKLSADWHEAVASHMDGPQFAFPTPWYPAGKVGNYEILPIDHSAALYREGATMHHCVGTYANEVKQGYIYIYSVRCEGKRLATLELVRNDRSASLMQIRGPCNAQPPKEITSTVQRWLRAQPPLALPERSFPGAAS